MELFDRPGAERLHGTLGPGGDQERRAAPVEPPRRVGQALRRRPVEPVRVIDHDQQRPVASVRADQAHEAGEHRQALVDGLLDRRQRERRRDRRRLRLRQLRESVEHRRRQLAERCERQVGLRLHSGRPGDLHLLGPLPGDRQQRRLADPGLAAQHQCTAAAAPRALQQRIDAIHLGFSTKQHASDNSRRAGSVRQAPWYRFELGVRPVLFSRSARTVVHMVRAMVNLFTPDARPAATPRAPRRRPSTAPSRRRIALLGVFSKLR